MNNKTLVFSAMALCSGASWASSCSEKDVHEHIFEKLHTAYEEHIVDYERSDLTLSLEGVRTRSVSEFNGASSCAATLVIEGSQATNRLPFTYTVEPTDDGNRWVTTKGLF